MEICCRTLDSANSNLSFGYMALTNFFQEFLDRPFIEPKYENSNVIQEYEKEDLAYRTATGWFMSEYQYTKEQIQRAMDPESSSFDPMRSYENLSLCLGWGGYYGQGQKDIENLLNIVSTYYGGDVGASCMFKGGPSGTSSFTRIDTCSLSGHVLSIKGKKKSENAFYRDITKIFKEFPSFCHNIYYYDLVFLKINK